MEELKLNLYNKILKIIDSQNKFEVDLIINYINENNIMHTKNSNGIFFNISVLDEDNILKLNKFIININSMDINSYENNNVNNNIYQLNINNIEKEEVYKDYNISNIEKKILKFSKI